MKRFCLMLFSIALLGFSTQIYSNQIRKDKEKRDLVPVEGTAFMFQQLPDTLKWSPDYKLNMGDFKKVTIGNTTLRHDSSSYRLLAFSSVAIGYSFKMEKGKTLFNAFALFVKSRSWMKAPDETVLKHEQGHFDIAEIYARKLEKAVREMKNLEDPSFWDSFQKTYDEINTLHLKEQEIYDEYAMTLLGQDYYYKKILDNLKASE